MFLSTLRSVDATPQAATVIVPGTKRFYALLPLDEERAAGLIAAERAHQLDRPPPADAEHPFEDRAVDHGGRKRGDLRDDFRQLKQPIGLGGQWGRASGSSMILHR